MAENLDATDWPILVELQRDGWIPLTELGRRVNLSASATSERVKRLESTGVITGYRADVDLAKTGFTVLAVVRLKYFGSKHQPLHAADRGAPLASSSNRRVPVVSSSISVRKPSGRYEYSRC